MEQIEKNFLLRIRHKKSDGLFADTDKAIEVLADLIESRIEGVEVDRKASRELIMETFKKIPPKKDEVKEKVSAAVQEILKSEEAKKLIEEFTGIKNV